MSAGHVYSQAPRCANCDERALLTKEAAQALATESHARLEARSCPHDESTWHAFPISDPDHPAGD